MLSDYKLNISDICNTPTGNVKKSEPNFSDYEKYVTQYGNFKLYLG